MPQVTYHGTRDDVRQLLRGVVSALAGQSADVHGVVQGLQLRIGNVLLSKVQQAFVVKSRGGMGEDGIKWQPLARSTIIGRRRGPADKKAIALKRRASALTEAQRRAMAKDIAKRAALLRVKFNLPSGQADGLARAQVEAIYRRKVGGVTTISSILGGRQVDILRDTSELFRSLTPGVEAIPSGADGQVLRTFQGVVTVGTNKKTWHHQGTRRGLPSRPFWPLDGDLPSVWWQAIHQSLARGLVQVLALVFSRGGRP